MRGGMNLLENKSVQEELKLTKEQVDKSKALTEGVRKKHEDDFAKIRDMSQEERQAFMKTINDETLKGLAGILKEDQLKRYKQIQLQGQARMMGPSALLNPDVEKGLKLTDDQIGKIKTIAEDVQKELRDLRESGQFGPETFQKMGTINKEGMEKASATLTADQKKAWKDLTGEPFEIKIEAPRRRGGDQQ